MKRIEIYRPLIADPKAIRKKRAERAKQEGRADRVTGGRPDAKRRTSDDVVGAHLASRSRCGPRVLGGVS